MKRNEDLRAIQDRLHRLGYYPDGGDGLFGPNTSLAIKKLLAAAELSAGIEPPLYPALPSNYKWLTNISPLPAMARAALSLLGTKEVPGRGDSPEVLAMAREVGLTKGQYRHDSIPWCGLAVAVVCHRAGKDFSMIDNILGSRRWKSFGVEVSRPGLGDVVVFYRGKKSGWQGHVGIYIAEDATHYHIAGGNQSDEFNISRIRKDRALHYRRPLYRNKPASVKPYNVAAQGRVTENEA